MIKHIKEENFTDEIGDKKVLVDFYANWCGPCKMLESVMEKFNKKNEIDILKVDVDEASNLSSKYKVFSIPTLILFENGKELKRRTGFMLLDELESWVNK